MKKTEIKNRFTGDVIFTYDGSNLSGSNLSGSDLRCSDLRCSDLSGSNLSGSDLSGSDLSGSDLRDSIKVPMYCQWSHGITNENLIHMGCEKRTIEEWDLFFASDKVILTQRNTQKFKQIHAVYEAYKAYLTILSK